jgi:hypothetical protein
VNTNSLQFILEEERDIMIDDKYYNSWLSHTHKKIEIQASSGRSVTCKASNHLNFFALVVSVKILPKFNSFILALDFIPNVYKLHRSYLLVSVHHQRQPGFFSP